jgi:hypothetical protein
LLCAEQKSAQSKVYPLGAQAVQLSDVAIGCSLLMLLVTSEMIIAQLSSPLAQLTEQLPEKDHVSSQGLRL